MLPAIVSMSIVMPGLTIAGRPTPGGGIPSMPRRFRTRPAACWPGGRARRRIAACSIMGPAFPRSIIPTAKTCSSRSRPCRRPMTPQNTRSPTTISTPSATCSRRCASCWSPPPADTAREGMQMSVRFSFKRSGEMIGPPRDDLCHGGRTRRCARRPISRRSTRRSMPACP